MILFPTVNNKGTSFSSENFPYFCTAKKYAEDCEKCKLMYRRAEYQKIKSRLEEERRFIQVVMGPRQIGKTTVVRQVLEDLDTPHC